MKTWFALGVSLLSLFAAGAPSATARSGDCRPVRAVFYTSGDWWRLAQILGANPSPCAQYYISVPPLVADKTKVRSNAAGQVRALGPTFHALAEVSYTAWQTWVAASGNSWDAAGQEIRRRMAAAGFDVAAGDTWAVNEFSSAVRSGTGGARQNVRDLVRGLFYGDGSVPQAKGIVFVVGVSQGGSGLPPYKASLESWFQDSAFWSDMSSYVSDFFQEAYGDVRSYAVAGADPATRAGLLNAYLQHPLQLASAAPDSAATARTYLSSAYGPLANAAWAWGSGYGWTQVGSDVMADFVSAETYAMRSSGIARIGFAWDASDPPGLAVSDFNAQTTGVLVRLAGAIHESDSGNPQQACEATGCTAVVDGAAAATGWNTFSSWTPTDAAFTSPQATLSTGTASGPLTLQLQTGGVPTTLPIPVSATLSSSSTGGAFATSSTGPWTPTLTVAIPPGTSSATFYALDSLGGSPTLTANLNGQVSTQVETVNAATPLTPALAPAPAPAAHVGAATLGQAGDLLHLSVQVVDDSGQPLQAQVSAALLRGSSTFAATSGHTSADGWFGLTASSKPAPGCYQADVKSITVLGYAWDGVTPAKTYCVLPAARIASIAFTRRQGRLHVAIRLVGDSGQPLQARVSLAVLHGTTLFASTAGQTNADGSLGLTAAPKLKAGCYRALVHTVTRPGYTWDSITPATHYCVRPGKTK